MLLSSLFACCPYGLVGFGDPVVAPTTNKKDQALSSEMHKYGENTTVL